MVSARESRHPRWPVPALAHYAFAGLLAVVLAAGPPAPAAGQDARPEASAHVLVGMAPDIGYEVTCDDSLLSLEPVPSNGLGIMEFIVDPRATGSPTKICVRVPAPPVIFGEQAGALTDTSCAVSWQTDRPALSRVEFGPTSGYGSTTPNSGKLSLLHSFTLEELEPSTLYHYRLHSLDAFGNETISGDMTFETLPERPRILGLTTEAVTDTSITLSWTTSRLCEARVEYGTASSHEHSTQNVPGFAVKHEVTIEELEPVTEYLLAAVGVDELGRTVRSADLTQSTAIPPLAVLSPAVVDTTMTTAVIGWRTTTSSRAWVDYGPSEQYGWTVDTGPTNSTEHLAVLEGLTAGATYHYRIRVTDEYGQSMETGDAVFATKPEGTPEVLTIHKLATIPVAPGSVTLSWVTNLPATTDVSWGLTDSYTDSYADSTLVTKHVVMLEDLDPARDYHASAMSITEVGTEASTGDFTFFSPPPNIAFLNTEVEDVGGDRLVVTWSTSYPTIGWLEYGTTPDCEQTTQPSVSPSLEHSSTAEGLEPLTTYYVRAAGAVGDFVDRSEVLTVMTAPPDLLVSTPAALDTSATTITLSWATTTPSYSYLRYGESEGYGLATGTNAIPSTEHTLVITGLSPSTEYHIQAVATDTLEQTAWSEDLIVVTKPFGPLEFRDAAVFDVGPSFASVSWQTSHRARGVVRYGTSTAYTDSVVVMELATQHSLVVTGLADGTTYHASVRAIDEDGQCTVSGDIVFTTSEYQDLAPPHAPSELELETEETAILLSWQANPEHDLAGYEVFRRSESDTAAVRVDVAPSYRTSFRDEEVVAGVVYEYAVSAFDGSGNMSERSEWVAVTAGIGAGARLWAWPNPLVDRTSIRLALPQAAVSRGETGYSVRIYDASGRLVRTLDAGTTSEPTVTVTWDGRDERRYPVSSGVYFCIASFDGGGARSKLVVLR